MKINWHWIAAGVFDWTILLLGIYLSYISLWFIPISMLIVGNRQHALGILGHDGAHRHVAKNRKLNDVITNFATMYPLGINLENYRKFHWDHHKFNGIKGKDPELPIKNIGPFPMKQKYSKRELYRDLCFDLLGFGVAQLLGFIIQVRPKTMSQFIPVLTMSIFMVCLLLGGFWLAILIWYLSMVTTFWMFFRYRVFYEHCNVPQPDGTLDIKPSSFSKWVMFPHNTWKHLLHHQKPGIPFNRLNK
jgi:fatty acid desaturase